MAPTDKYLRKEAGEAQASAAGPSSAVMTIRLQKGNAPMALEAFNAKGNRVAIDASPDIGGQDQGVRPMELLLAGLGGCSGIDVMNILRKQKYSVEDLRIEVEAERDTDGTPALFRSIRVDFQYSGDAPESKLERAVSLSMDKYCSVARILEQTARIEHTFSKTPS